MKERPMTMVLTWASLGVAAQKLKDLQLDDETANSLLLELETATNLTDAFNRTWHSIHWNSARKSTKVRVTITLRKMAEMILDYLEESVRLFDQLCDEQSRFPTIPLTDDWLEIRSSLRRSKEEFEKTHYPAKALEDLAQEVVEMSQEVQDNYSEYQQSGRFLKGAEDEEEVTETNEKDMKDIPILVENLPDVDDDEQVLFASQIEAIIQNQPPEIIEFVRQQFNVSGRIKKMSALTRKLAPERTDTETAISNTDSSRTDHRSDGDEDVSHYQW